MQHWGPCVAPKPQRARTPPWAPTKHGGLIGAYTWVALVLGQIFGSPEDYNRLHGRLAGPNWPRLAERRMLNQSMGAGGSVQFIVTYERLDGETSIGRTDQPANICTMDLSATWCPLVQLSRLATA